MDFKTAAMGYHQINTTFHLKWLLMDKKYDFSINYIEFDPVQCGIGMPFPKWPSFSNMTIIFPVHI